MFKTLESFTASPHCVHTGLWNIRGGMLRKPLKYLLSLLLIITAATRCFAVDDVTLDVTKSAYDNSNFTSASGKTVNITVTGRTPYSETRNLTPSPQTLFSSTHQTATFCNIPQ